jgi:hypothetical protein
MSARWRLRDLGVVVAWAVALPAARAAFAWGVRAFCDTVFSGEARVTPLVLGVMGAMLPIGLARWASVGARAAVWRAGVAIGLLALSVGAWQRHQEATRGPLGRMRPPVRQIGVFPYAEGPRPTPAADRQAVAHILSDGTRDCGSPAGERVVAFVGDSFTFGKGVPDDGTTCWKVAAALGSHHPGWRFVNLGQSGANAHSVLDTARFAIDAHGADVLLVELLVFDDARAVDVNGHAHLARNPAFQLIASLVGFGVAMDGAMLLPEVFDADFYSPWAMDDAVQRLVALHEETGVPMVLQVNTGPSAHGYAGRLWETADTEASRRPAMWSVPRGPIMPPDGDSVIIVGDGHPTPGANTVRARRMAPVIAEAMAYAEAAGAGPGSARGAAGQP